MLETLDLLRAIVAELETERRGYLMTLDPAYLKAYGVSDESVRREAQALQTLVADDPLQGLRAGHLALTVAATLREIDELLKTAGTSGLAALAMIRSMDEIRSQSPGLQRLDYLGPAGTVCPSTVDEQDASRCLGSVYAHSHFLTACLCKCGRAIDASASPIGSRGSNPDPIDHVLTSDAD